MPYILTRCFTVIIIEKNVLLFFTSKMKFLHLELAKSTNEIFFRKITIVIDTTTTGTRTSTEITSTTAWIIDSDESIILLFLTTEREFFIKKYLAFNHSSLYKVDLQQFQFAGREVREETQAEDVKRARWLEYLGAFYMEGKRS